jgi:hypothetical protein
VAALENTFKAELSAARHDRLKKAKKIPAKSPHRFMLKDLLGN